MAGPQAERPPKKIDGYAKLVAMFRELDPINRIKLLEKLRAGSPILARLVERLDFTWWDIPKLDDKSIQKVLMIIPDKDWLMAWKLADDSVKAVLLANMSEERKLRFLADFENLPRVPRTQVQKIMFNIGARIRELAMNGEVKLLTRPRRRLKLGIKEEKK